MPPAPSWRAATKENLVGSLRHSCLLPFTRDYRMDLAIFGILASFAAIGVSIFLNGNIASFADLPSFFIVIVGTFTCTFTQFSPRLVFSVFWKALRYKKRLPSESRLAELMINMAYHARREGILALEQRVSELENPFLAKGFRLAIDGLDPESIRDVLETEMQNLQNRHNLGAQVLEVMASFAPALGMMGTVIGLVQMLHTMADPSTIGPAMAVALITTFYGIIAANLILMPLGGRLRLISAAEMRYMEMGTEGVLGIARGENPRIIREKLESFMPLSHRATPED